MIGYVMIGNNDLARAALFSYALLTPLELIQLVRVKSYATYALKVAQNAIEFYVSTQFDQLCTTPWIGKMLALAAPAMQAVEHFHGIGLKNGGKDEGALGPCEKGSGIYYADLRDFDSKRICAFYDDEKERLTDG